MDLLIFRLSWVVGFFSPAWVGLLIYLLLKKKGKVRTANVVLGLALVIQVMAILGNVFPLE